MADGVATLIAIKMFPSLENVELSQTKIAIISMELGNDGNVPEGWKIVFLLSCFYEDVDVFHCG